MSSARLCFSRSSGWTDEDGAGGEGTASGRRGQPAARVWAGAAHTQKSERPRKRVVCAGARGLGLCVPSSRARPGPTTETPCARLGASCPRPCAAADKLPLPSPVKRGRSGEEAVRHTSPRDPHTIRVCGADGSRIAPGSRGMARENAPCPVGRVFTPPVDTRGRESTSGLRKGRGGFDPAPNLGLP